MTPAELQSRSRDTRQLLRNLRLVLIGTSLRTTRESMAIGAVVTDNACVYPGASS